LGTAGADLGRALESLQEGCQVIGRDRRYLYVNAAAARQAGRNREELLGRTMTEVFPGVEHSLLYGAVCRCLDEGTSSRVETQYPSSCGTTGWLDVCVQAIPEGAFVLSMDVTVRKEAEQGLLRPPHLDAVTGLPPCAHLEECFARMTSADRTGNGGMALLVVGVRRLREVNFALGRRHGDALLRSVASRIRSALAESAEIARLDGDHFGILLAGAGGAAVAERAAGAIHEAVGGTRLIEGLSVDVSAGVGIALCPEHGTDFPTLLRNAEVALHVARLNDSSQAVYAPAADRFTPRRLALMADLVPAIEQQQFVLHYQPIVELANGAVVGLEALVRWNHPTHGTIPPIEFISLAEHTGAIRPLTLWVLQTALTACRELRRAGWPLTMAVNISARNLADGAFVEQLEAILVETDTRAGWLELELTESVLMRDPDRAREMLDRLGRLGLRVSIDDFGTGYSSLGYLRKLPVHTLKIDRSFLGVGGPTPGRRDSVIIRAVVDVGHALGLTVVAEGVETEEALDFLRTMRCDRAQGYHIEKPMPAGQMMGWLAESPWGRRTSRAPARAHEGPRGET
ncbi:MAG: EAL domain-containing protein, partial [Deltaproteobacteria bacterium]|nr:EAL domain-containing protein [Deltaproteobacteria bacterium]